MWLSGLTLAMTLTLNFQGQALNLLYLSQKWSDCNETISKHIDWTQGHKCDHHLWPWPWPWPWFFKVKYVICYISAQNGPIAMKRKANIPIELKASNVTIRFDLGHQLDLEFSRSTIEFAFSQPKRSDYHETKSKRIEWIPGLKWDQWVWPWQWPWSLNFQGQMSPRSLTIHMVLTKDFHGQVLKYSSCISEWEGRVTLNKGGGSRSFMTMTVTIWWPRSGERIYHKVTGVTSDVGVPSTRLVNICVWENFLRPC